MWTNRIIAAILKSRFYLLLIPLFLACGSTKIRPVDYYPIVIDAKLGFIDKTGKVIIKPKFETPYNYSEYEFTEGLACVMKHNKWGFINYNGRFIIKPKFDDFAFFESGKAVVRFENKEGLIDSNGEWVIEPKYSDISKLKHGLYELYIWPNVGLARNSGQILVEPQYTAISDFAEGKAMARKGWDYCLLDTLGKVFNDTTFKVYGNYSEGLAQITRDMEFGYINMAGEIVIEPKFYRAWPFREGKAYVSINDTDCFINTKGEIVLKTRFNNIAYDYNEGFAILCDRPEITGYFFINHENDTLNKIPYHDACQFHNNYAFVSRKGCYTWIDTSNNRITDYKFEHTTSLSPEPRFQNGFVKIELAGRYGIMDTNGIYHVPPEYHNIWYENEFGSSGVSVRKNNKWGFINSKGVITLPLIFDHCTKIRELIKTRIDDKTAYYNLKGDVVWSESGYSSTNPDIIEYNRVSELIFISGNDTVNCTLLKLPNEVKYNQGESTVMSDLIQGTRGEYSIKLNTSNQENNSSNQYIEKSFWLDGLSKKYVIKVKHMYGWRYDLDVFGENDFEVP